MKEWVMDVTGVVELQAAEATAEQRENLVEQLNTRIEALEEDVQSSSSLVSSLLEKGKSGEQKFQTLVRLLTFCEIRYISTNR